MMLVGQPSTDPVVRYSARLFENCVSEKSSHPARLSAPKQPLIVPFGRQILLLEGLFSSNAARCAVLKHELPLLPLNLSASKPGKLPVAPSAATTPAVQTTGLVFVGHGSRVASANQSFEALVRRFATRNPDFTVSHGYVELASPTLEEALLAAGRKHQRVVILPLFLFAAGHVKNDLPLVLHRVRSVLPDVDFAPSGALGVHAELVQLAAERLQAQVSEQEAPRTAVLMLGRGSSDADANADFCKLSRLVAETGTYSSVTPCFMGITTPSLEDALELVARSRPERIVVVPYLIFQGRLTEKLAERVHKYQARSPWTKIDIAKTLVPVGVDEPRMNAALDERIAQAREGLRPLPCDTCQYRVPLSKVSDSVGGLKALLWSLRHAFTHTQAMPHEHAHPPLAKHVLVCGNADCADRGSIALLSQLRRILKRAGRAREIRVTRTLCMGRCGEGPTVAVYPDGVWYRGVRPEDAQELVDEHLLKDRLVGRLVDNIMQ